MPKSDRQSNEPHAGWGALRAKLAALLAQLRSCPDQTATRCAFSRRLPQKMANLGYRPSMLEPMYVLKSQLEALNLLDMSVIACRTHHKRLSPHPNNWHKTP
jgi:hypothetical protein